MLFSSISFLYLFLPAVLTSYFVMPRPIKNYVLLIFSLLFYFLGEPVYTVLLIFSSVSDYAHSLFIEKHRAERSSKAALVSSIVINLLLLGIFKYADFAVSIMNGIFKTHIPMPNIPLPLGISFFTFQTMSYTIDVYRGSLQANRNFVSFSMYVCLFPQLVAGPIVRYSEIESELNNRQITLDSLYLGIRRFVLGLSKKVLLANSLGGLCETFRSSSEKTVMFYWLYAVAFALQIYFDFSGYSDMAIGLGRIFGFSFPENFNYPFISKSITEFWRRWHITLGRWFRDYVYIPLGGNRVSVSRWVLNIIIVWLLTGIWHGADLNFLLWGLMFGILLIAEKLFLNKLLSHLGFIASHTYVIFILLLSFVLFNGNGISGAFSDLAGMFGAGGIALCNAETLYHTKSYSLLLLLAILGATPFPNLLASRIRGLFATIAEPAMIAALMIAVTASLIEGSFNPFLYFRF